ncbi:P-loop containing nucleoside triphosphate hydrolase protein [Mycena olivaceomarginata]|nr:P-loop containing nucleoside triphosphate hydrolase protein [Mycena olivaceomarginata]
MAATTEKTNDCPRPSRIFCGRQEILGKMYQYFTKDLGKQHIYVLYGLGGAGKTQIALKFIDKSLHFTDRFFLDASTTETLDTSIKNIATMKNIGSSSQDALKWLCNRCEDWLLFFDNADDPEINMNNFFPQCNHGNIIITSRNPNLRVYGAHSHVSDMEEPDAVALLLESSVQDISSTNTQVAVDIVKELSYLPLAIVQAGAFILESGTLNTYLDLYAKNRAELLKKKAAQSHDDYTWTVYTTWQMSFDRLSKAAAMFLQLCSFLHQEGISEEIFRWAATYNFSCSGPSKEELRTALDFLSQFLQPSGEWDPLAFLKLANELKAYSLINPIPERKMFSIHPLVHSWSRSILSDTNSKLYHSIVGSILGMAISEIPDHDIQLASLRLLPHVESVFLVNTEGNLHFRAEYGRIFSKVGKYKQAEKLQTAVLDKQIKLLGSDHPDTLLAMGNLAATYSDLGEYKKAEELQISVLKKQKPILHEDHRDTLHAMTSLALTCCKLHDYKRAEELQLAVLQKRKQLLGDDHLDTLSAMGNLAFPYRSMGDFDKAKELEIIVLEKRTELLGGNHPDTLHAMHDLAETYDHLGEFKQAEALGIIALGARKQLLGDNHPDTLLTMGNLASTYSHLGQFKNAKDLEIVVLDQRKRLLGENHPDTLLALDNLASTYFNLREFKRAEELEVIMLEKRKQLLGDDHPDTLLAMQNLVFTSRKLGKMTEAEELEQAANNGDDDDIVINFSTHRPAGFGLEI